MSDLFFDMMKQLSPALRRGETEQCERAVAAELKKLPNSPFQLVLERSIENDPAEAARFFDRFFDREMQRFKIGAAYTEMNGFDINPGRWFCDVLAYKADYGHEDYDWLSEWHSERFEDYTITGLEELQSVYASDAFRAKEYRDACRLCSLMVVIKFQRFMQQAVRHMELLKFPLYVTAHDFDFIASFDPRPEAERRPTRRPTADERVEEAMRELKDSDSGVRFDGVRKLYSSGPAGKRAVGMLIERLKDDDTALCQFAATALAQIDPSNDAVVAALVERLQNSRDELVRREVVRALGYSRTKTSADALEKVLFDDDLKVRQYAVISIKLHGPVAAHIEQALRKLMETDPDQSIQIQGEAALRAMRRPTQ
jgi:hypothetical protein